MNDTDTFFDFEDALLTELHAARARSAGGQAAGHVAGRAAERAVTVPGRRGRARRLGPVAAAGAVAAAAVAAVAVANTGGTDVKPASTDVKPASAAGGLPSSSSVRNAVLAAFDASAGDIAHAHIVTVTPGEPTMVQDLWQSPSTTRTGTVVHFRSRISWGGALQQDVGMIWTQPAGASARKTVTGELIDVEYSGKRWSDQKATLIAAAPVFGADQVRNEIAQGYLHVDGRAMAGGEKAIKLSLRGVRGDSSTVWIDASTYLPIKSVSIMSVGTPGQTITTGYQMLPATPGNLASLNVLVPTGFTKTATPPAHPHG
jgi:hypothetical protein